MKNQDILIFTGKLEAICLFVIVVTYVIFNLEFNISNFGIILQLIGFILFLFYKKHSHEPITVEGPPVEKCVLGDTINNFATKHPRLSVNFLPFGVFFIIIGLALTLTFKSP